MAFSLSPSFNLALTRNRISCLSKEHRRQVIAKVSHHTTSIGIAMPRLAFSREWVLLNLFWDGAGSGGRCDACHFRECCSEDNETVEECGSNGDCVGSDYRFGAVCWLRGISWCCRSGSVFAWYEGSENGGGCSQESYPCQC